MKNNWKNFGNCYYSHHNFETAKEYHKFLFDFVLYAVALISKSLVSKKIFFT